MIPTCLQQWGRRSPFCALFILTWGLSHPAPLVPPHLPAGAAGPWGFLYATCRHWGTVRGHHLRASFCLNVPRCRAHHKVLSFQSSKQDTGFKCCQQADYPPSPWSGGSQWPIHFSSLVSSKSLPAPFSDPGRYFLFPAASLLHGLLYNICQAFWDLAPWNPQIIFLLINLPLKGRPGLTLISETCFKCLFWKPKAEQCLLCPRL